MKKDYIEIEIDGTRYLTCDIGESIEIEIEEEATDIVGVCPPIAGTIVEILKCEGERVKRGEKIAILDAMKMYNYITSPCNGIISSVFTEAGMRVKRKDVIMEIEET